jgi:hypothetical protein
MRRHSLLKYLAFWTGEIGRPSAAPGPASSARPSVCFTPQQLDRLYEDLAPGLPEIPPERSSVWHDEGADMVRRQARFLCTVDRAIAEIATSRKRSLGFPLRTSLTRHRRPSEAADPRRRTRTGPRRRPA